MIGKLKGKVDSIFEEYLILDVNGVGYRVFCSTRTLASLELNTEISLFIQTVVKEDSITLFGFLNNYEKEWFETLCKVNGIGNKMAMKIMGTLTINDILMAIDSGDAKIFCRAPGIGQKIASRIIVELKDFRKNVAAIETDIGALTASSIPNFDGDSRLKDALSALENLGYQKSTAHGIIVGILKEREDIVIESLITEALKRINNF